MIRSFLVFTVAALIGLIIQATLVHTIYPSAVAPDFIIILVTYIALRFRAWPGAIAAFCLGLLADFASGQFLGPNACGAVVGYLVVVGISGKVYAEKQMAMAILCFFASLAKSSVFLVMLFVYLDVAVLTQSVITTCFLEAIISAALSPFVMFMLDWRPNASKRRNKHASGVRSWAS